MIFSNYEELRPWSPSQLERSAPGRQGWSSSSPLWAQHLEEFSVKISWMKKDGGGPGTVKESEWRTYLRQSSSPVKGTRWYYKSVWETPSAWRWPGCPENLAAETVPGRGDPRLSKQPLLSLANFSSSNHHPPQLNTQWLLLLTHLPNSLLSPFISVHHPTPGLASFNNLTLMEIGVVRMTFLSPPRLSPWCLALITANIFTAPSRGHGTRRVHEGQAPTGGCRDSGQAGPQDSAATRGVELPRLHWECQMGCPAPGEPSAALHSGSVAGLSHSLREDIINSPAGTLRWIPTFSAW